MSRSRQTHPLIRLVRTSGGHELRYAGQVVEGPYPDVAFARGRLAVLSTWATVAERPGGGA